MKQPRIKILGDGSGSLVIIYEDLGSVIISRGLALYLMNETSEPENQKCMAKGIHAFIEENNIGVGKNFSVDKMATNNEIKEAIKKLCAYKQKVD